MCVLGCIRVIYMTGQAPYLFKCVLTLCLSCVSVSERNTLKSLITIVYFSVSPINFTL